MLATQSLLLFFLFLPSLSVARRGGGHGIDVGVEVAFQFAEPIDISVFSFDVVFAVVALFQAYALVTRLLCRPDPASNGAGLGSPTYGNSPLPEDHKPGSLFTALLALASLSSLAYWILSAVYEALMTSSEDIRRFDFLPAFYICWQWLYRFTDTLLFAAVLLLLHRRACIHPTAPPTFKSIWKSLLDAGLLLWAVITQVVGAVLNSSTFNGYFKRRRTYLNAYYAYNSSEILIALDVVVTSLVLRNVLSKDRIVDPVIRTIAKRIAPLLMIVALFGVVPPVLWDPRTFRHVGNIDFSALNLSETLIYGICTLLVILYCLGIGQPAEKSGDDEERHR